MPLCLNPECQKRIPENAVSCRFCGSTEIAQFDSYSKQEALAEELTMENLHKVMKNSKPAIERTILPSGCKGSRKSRITVRLQYVIRKLTFRR